MQKDYCKVEAGWSHREFYASQDYTETMSPDNNRDTSLTQHTRWKAVYVPTRNRGKKWHRWKAFCYKGVSSL